MGKKPDSERRRQVIELLRVSTDKQVELGGLESQHADCVRIAEQNRVEMHAEHQLRLAGISGKNVRLTPEVQRLETMLKSGQFEGVVMVEDTRLMRPDEPEDYALLQVFKDNNAKIFTRSMVHDLSTPDGQMLMSILFAIAGRERHVIRQRTYGKREKLRSRGLCASGATTLPFGITRVRFRDGDGDRWAFAYLDADISRVNRLFTMFVEGETSFRALALATGISYFQIAGILSNTAYTGIRTYDKRVDPKQDVVDSVGRLRYQVKVKREDDDIERIPMLGVDGKPLPPAVPLDIFARAQSLLALKREMRWQRNNTEPEHYTFRGFLRCSSCGSRLLSVSHRATKGGSLREYYVCRASYGSRKINKDGSSEWYDMPDCGAPRIRRERIEVMLEDTIVTKLADPDFLYKLMLSQRNAMMRGDNKAQITRAKKEVESLEDEQARTDAMFQKGRKTEDWYDAQCDRLDAALKAARKHLASLVPSGPVISPEALVKVIAPFDRWALKDADERRALLTAVCPQWDISATSNGGRGAGAKTTVKIMGFWMRLGAGEDAPGADDGRGGMALVSNRRVNTSDSQLVNSEDRTPTVHTTDQLVYFPLAA